ncbi:Protein EARLY FLOWERING like [Actinidia chinensis var. chinensis]|uniref:Protein EARLY FLOWERING like n=1 Tax=Actinidia chinensis var. chinensis TaxID=1590841 RepID=A0A2R6PUW3_ACTCC|nr:Protein EARLY FLOWERING like [Actinidia chinensis var. chinensis]
MMKGGNEEEKLMGPLFPRLHIKDAEKGGPKAPPRNKMALYEQFSVPSQRFAPGSPSILPLPSNNNSSSVPPTPSSHGGGQNRNPYSPISNSPALHLAKRLHSYSSDGRNLNTTSINLEWKSGKPTKCPTSNAAGHISMTANFSCFQPHIISKNSSEKKLPNEVDFEVPTFLQSGKIQNIGNGHQNKDKQKLTASSPIRQIQSEENSTSSPSCRDRAKRPASILTNGDKVLGEEKRSRLVYCSNKLHETDAQLHDDRRDSQEKKALRDSVSSEPKKAIGKSDASVLEGVSCLRTSAGDNYGSPTRLESVDECHEDRCGPLQVGEVGRNVCVSEKPNGESVSGMEISPDDVVGVIGQKQFWEARKAIVQQQRVFAVQVFELHRLIKVQRLFAASPGLLLESELYLGKSSIQVLPAKKLPSENVLEAPPSIVKPKNDPQKPNPISECTTENSNIKLNTQQSKNKPASATSGDAKPPPWFFHPPPPGNQWLVPVMSPSEGLVYKPYTGPCPPTSCLMLPFYGEDFSNTHRQRIGNFGQTYFPPYGMPLMNLSVSSSAVEQASKESEVMQGSSTSRPPEKVLEGDALPLFPTDPTVKVPDQPAQTHSTTEQPTRVIKVVPHNPRSASESAARIFQSIQEERRQFISGL